jgi:hypothetical protein
MAHTSADATSLSPWWRHSVILVMIAVINRPKFLDPGVKA